MLVKFTMSDDKISYINTDHVIAISESGTVEEPMTIVHFNSPEVYSFISLHVDTVALMLGLEPKHEPGFIPLNLSIAELDLPVRAYNILRREGINTVGELMQEKWSRIAGMRNMGNVSMTAIFDALKDLGLELPGTPHWRP